MSLKKAKKKLTIRFGSAKSPKKPGSKGGKFWRDDKGNVRYGEKPKEKEAPKPLQHNFKVGDVVTYYDEDPDVDEDDYWIEGEEGEEDTFDETAFNEALEEATSGRGKIAEVDPDGIHLLVNGYYINHKELTLVPSKESQMKKSAVLIFKDTYMQSPRGSHDTAIDVAPMRGAPEAPTSSNLADVKPEPKAPSASAGAKQIVTNTMSFPHASGKVAPAKVSQTPTPEPVHDGQQAIAAGSMEAASPSGGTQVAANSKPQVKKADGLRDALMATMTRQPKDGPVPKPKRGEKAAEKRRAQAIARDPNSGGTGRRVESAAPITKPQVTKAIAIPSYQNVEKAPVVASPDAASKPPSYLPGVHSPNSPMRPGKKPRVKKCDDSHMHKAYDVKPPMKKPKKVAPDDVATVKQAPPTLAEAATNLRSGVRKSIDGDTANSNKETDMSDKAKNEMEKLFKSELGGEDAITKCVHCKTDLTKSDLRKGAGSHFVADDNDNPHDGSEKGSVEPSRGVPGAKENDTIAPLLKGIKGPEAGENEEFLISKSEMEVMGMDVSDQKDDSDETHYTITKSEMKRLGCEQHIPFLASKKAHMMKSTKPLLMKGSEQVRQEVRSQVSGPNDMRHRGAHDPHGNPLVQWFDSGEDQAIAKAIETQGAYGQGHDELSRTRGPGH